MWGGYGKADIRTKHVRKGHSQNTPSVDIQFKAGLLAHGLKRQNHLPGRPQWHTVLTYHLQLRGQLRLFNKLPNSLLALSSDFEFAISNPKFRIKENPEHNI